MLNLKDWMGSKKTKDMIFGEALLLVVLLIVLYMTGGAPDKVKALLAALMPLLVPMFGLIGLKIGAQGIADFGRMKPKEYILQAAVESERKAAFQAKTEAHRAELVSSRSKAEDQAQRAAKK